MMYKYAVFGNPIAHSLSPLIHKHFAKECGIDLSYEKILVEDGTFVKTAQDFLAKGGLGFNITVPCKIEALNFVKEHGVLSNTASLAGAVNTIAYKDGKILGDNTDGFGLCLDLKRLSCPLEGSSVLVIGAGGAVRGIIEPLFVQGKVDNIVLVNRTYEKACALAGYFASLGFKISAEDFSSLKGDFKVIINASSSSLQKQLPPMEDEILNKAQFAYDLMYHVSGETIFTQKMQSLGVKAYDGLGMLVAQASRSFEIWQGVRPSIENTLAYMREVLKSHA